MTDHIFDEPERNMVAHTKASLALVTVPNLAFWAEGFTGTCASMTEVKAIHEALFLFTDSCQLPVAMGRWPGSEKETETVSSCLDCLSRWTRGSASVVASDWMY